MSLAPRHFSPAAARAELNRITEWWLQNSPDEKHGGFLGEIDFRGRPVEEARKGIILNSRILWFFSELSLLQPHPRHRQMADRAFHYLLAHFDDAEHGGVFWELDPLGSVTNSKKQTYALAQCIYAFSSYFRLSAEPAALDQSLAYMESIETHARDRQHGGYIEALSRDWQPLQDMRLGAEDMNAPKSMNTHLHVLEAYTGLYQASPSPDVAIALRHSLECFCEHIVNRPTGHLLLFFDMHWAPLSSRISFGHDIEASWLLLEAAEALGDEALLREVKYLSGLLAEHCLREGIGPAGQLCDEWDPDGPRRSEQGIWWVQAEALLGFLQACILSGESGYRDACDAVWQFLRQHHLDTDVGEWHWMATGSDQVPSRHYKMGFWKGPYHNGRAMMYADHLLRRLGET